MRETAADQLEEWEKFPEKAKEMLNTYGSYAPYTPYTPDSSVFEMFIFSETKQGRDFWFKIYEAGF